MMAMVMEVMDIVKDRSCNACDKRDRDRDGSEGHCYRTEAVIHVMNVLAMMIEVMDIVIGSKL